VLSVGYTDPIPWILSDYYTRHFEADSSMTGLLVAQNSLKNFLLKLANDQSCLGIGIVYVLGPNMLAEISGYLPGSPTSRKKDNFHIMLALDYILASK